MWQEIKKNKIFSASCTSHNRGFSLIELLVVLVLLGVMAGLAAPVTGRFLDNLAFKKQTGRVMATLRYVRLMALSKGEAVRVRVEEGENRLFLSGGLAGTRELGLKEGDILEIEPKEIVFYPEGYATPGRLSFWIGERVQVVIIDPLTSLPLLL